VGTTHGDIIAKADGRTPPAVGGMVNLGAEIQNIHVFDVESGAALT
jgi:multiple sugar transport system ATP-binding protein